MTDNRYNLLYRIDSPADLRRLAPEELRTYCDELRRYIMSNARSIPGIWRRASGPWN